jgi:hypothetical protein
VIDTLEDLWPVYLTNAEIDDTPMMLPPGGDCFAICCAAACTAKNAPFRFVEMV